MTISQRQQLHLIGAIYDAALDASRWDAVMREMVVGALEGNGGGLLLSGASGRRILSITGVGRNALQERNYNEYYGRLDPIAPALEVLADGTILPHHAIVAPAQARKTEFYSDYALPIDSGDGMAVRVRVDNGSIAWLNVCAPLRGSPFVTPKRVALLQSLLPHLQRSLRVQAVLGDLVVERERAYSALDLLEHGVVLVGRSGKVLFANTMASTLCRGVDGIIITRNEVLHARRADEDGLLQRLIGRAAGEAAPQGGSMMVYRPSGARPFAVHVLPLGPDEAHPPLKEASAMVVIVDTEREPLDLTETLSGLYRLTRSEARVAACVLQGEGLQRIAETLQVTLSTVRIHLQRVFEKTGTHRQAELVRLLLRLHAGLKSRTAVTKGGDA